LCDKSFSFLKKSVKIITTESLDRASNVRDSNYSNYKEENK